MRSTSAATTRSCSAESGSQAARAESCTSPLIAASGFFSSCESFAEMCSISRARASARYTISSRARPSWQALSPMVRVKSSA